MNKDTEKGYIKEVLSKFKDDLRLYPKSNYIKTDKMENMGDGKNETWYKYYYSFSLKEFEIFDELELIDHSEKHKSFIFGTSKFSINNIEHLVSIFFSIFGVDSSGKGKFDDGDSDEIIQQNFWMGRIWTDYEKYSCAVMISFDSEGPKLDLCVKW